MADEKAPAGDNPYTQTHVVQSGDTLSKIAQKYYGDASLYKQIFEANRDILKDPNKIRSETEDSLIVPVNRKRYANMKKQIGCWRCWQKAPAQRRRRLRRRSRAPRAP
jgi:hypothetical protein